MFSAQSGFKQYKSTRYHPYSPAIVCTCLSFLVWSCFALETDSDSQKQKEADRDRKKQTEARQRQTKTNGDSQRQTGTDRDRPKHTETDKDGQTTQRIIRKMDKEFPLVPPAVAWGCTIPGNSAWFMPPARACCLYILLVPLSRAFTSYL